MKIIDITSKVPRGNYKVGRDGYTVKGIVCHITADKIYNNAVNWFCNPQSGVSAHYVIEKNGDIFMCVAPENKAYHAGIVNKSTAKIFFDMDSQNPNLYTIGIECVSAGEPLTDVQYQALKDLITKLCQDYNIPCDRYHIIGHYETDSVSRANDPKISYSVDKLVSDLNQPKIQIKPINETRKISAELLNVRELPNTNCNILGQVKLNDIINAIGISDDGQWYKILYNRTESYISAKYTIIYDSREDDIKKIVSAGVISSPDYWLQNAKKDGVCNGEYVSILIKNIAKRL